MYRFFLSPESIRNGNVLVTGPLVHRLAHVLRIKKGDTITFLDNTGWEYTSSIQLVGSERIEAEVIDRTLSTREPRLSIKLYQAILKISKFEFVLQKCTEVGVCEFVPMISQRCIADEPGKSRCERWHYIIIEAAQQSGRGKIPILHPLMTFGDVCNSIQGTGFLPWEQEKETSLRSALASVKNRNKLNELSFLIGPEGGFLPEEVDIARRCGIMPISLGRRILRAETAGIIAAATALYEFDEL